MDDSIQIIYNSMGGILLKLGDHAVALEREEAEQLFVDLGHALQDQDKLKEEDKDAT